MPSIKTIGTQIIAEVKKIRKRHPNMKWTTAMKEAGAKYRKSHKKKRSKK